MSSSFFLCNTIEKMLGSLCFAGLVMMLATFTNFLYLFIYWVMWNVNGVRRVCSSACHSVSN
jgi:hypothetical protein